MNNITMKMNVDELILMALREDISSEDITTNSVMREYKKGQFSFFARKMELLQVFMFSKEHFFF